MWHIHPTEKWIEDVVKNINDKQLNIEDSKFMIAFFSSMDNDFVHYFQTNKNQISSFSGENFHIFTPVIFDDRVIPDEDWRYMRREFNTLGVPVNTEPTFVFFNLKTSENGSFEPNFFAGFTCETFDAFPNKLKNAIDSTVEIKDTKTLQQKLTEVFRSKNIIPYDNINKELKKTLTRKLPKSTIFISHSSVDKPFARKLMNELSADSDLKFWIDEQEILVGDDIQKTVTKNLKQSDYLILIISENSIKSSWVNFEVTQFMGFANDKNIIPIIISKGQKFPEPLDNLIRRLKYLDFSDDNNWKRNTDEIKRLLTIKNDNDQKGSW